MKHKPNEIVFINETLEPIIIEIGKIEKSIIGKIIFMFSIFFILMLRMLLCLIFQLSSNFL